MARQNMARQNCVCYAFLMQQGLFCFAVMHFGLCNAPATDGSGSLWDQLEDLPYLLM